MSMKAQISNLLLASAILGGSNQMPVRHRKITPENGNDKRTHKQNVKRRRLRRISKRSKAINRN